MCDWTTRLMLNNRDIILVFGYQSDTEYYYADLSQDNTIYAHNGIFEVDGADRERIDHQYDGSVERRRGYRLDGTTCATVRHRAETGEIAVWVDGLDRPLLTATDTAFTEGRIGFWLLRQHWTDERPDGVHVGG